MKKVKTMIIATAMLFSAGCVSNGTFLDVLTAPDGADLERACADRSGIDRFKNRVDATTKSVEGKVEAAKILVGPATLPFAGIEGLYVGGRNIYDNIFNGVDAKAADARCADIE